MSPDFLTDLINQEAYAKVIASPDYRSARNSWELGYISPADFQNKVTKLISEEIPKTKARLEAKMNPSEKVTLWSDVFHARITLNTSDVSDARAKLAKLEEKKLIDQGGGTKILTPQEQSDLLAAKLQQLQAAMNRKEQALLKKLARLQEQLNKATKG